MAVELFSRPNFHERMLRIWGDDLGVTCISSGLAIDRTTVSLSNALICFNVNMLSCFLLT